MPFRNFLHYSCLEKNHIDNFKAIRNYYFKKYFAYNVYTLTNFLDNTLTLSHCRRLKYYKTKSNLQSESAEIQTQCLINSKIFHSPPTECDSGKCILQ